MRGIAAFFLFAAFCAGNTLGAAPAQELEPRVCSFEQANAAAGTDGFTRVTLPGCETWTSPGKPVLPHRGVSFELPQGFTAEDVSCEEADTYDLPLASRVIWGQPPVTDGAAPAEVEADAEVYGADALYPASPVVNWRTDSSADGVLVSVDVFPARVNPVRNILHGARTLRLVVRLKALPKAAQGGAATLSTVVSPLDPAVTNDYVILTTMELATNTPAPWDFQALAARRAADGFRPAIVTAEWVDEHYAGSNRAVRVRAFAQDAYQHCGLKYLLIGGTFGMIPVMKFRVSYNNLLTTYVRDIPADALYFGCMEGTFDNNGNDLYGEVGDGVNGGDVDLTAEVMVGRFPVESASEVAAMVRKTLRYESAPSEAFTQHAFMAERVNFGSTVYATGFMEELRLGTKYTIGFGNSAYASQFGYSTLYDSNSGEWTAQKALAFLNADFPTINHLGHGLERVCMKINVADKTMQNALQSLTNSLPYFIYSGACSAGAFDTSNCFAEVMVTASNAAVGAVMSARESWADSGSISGVNHAFQKMFWDSALRGTATHFGEINEASRLANLAYVARGRPTLERWVYYELNLFGDPALPFAKAINLAPPTFSHTPLINTYATNIDYAVECSVEPIGIYDPASVELLWSTDSEAGTVHTQKMANTEGNLYRGAIPAQVANTRVEYRLTAKNAAGVTGLFPSDGTSYVFYVTDRLSLTVLGSRNPFGTVSPDYGTIYFASGLCATVSAPSIVPLTETTRVRLDGFIGTGSAPEKGEASTNVFMMRENTFFVWKWQHQNRLLLSATNDLFAEIALWADAGEACETPAAPASVAETNGTVWTFAEWLLDGARTPAAPSDSPPACGELTMETPHALYAVYLPQDWDSDTNAIPDWYELRYYGTAGQDAKSDTDKDGYSLAEEFADRSNPLDAKSIPGAPVIVFSPLDEIQTAPGPYVVQAQITDTLAVERAVLRWRRNGGAWMDTPMSLVSNDLYEAEFGADSLPADDFEYLLEARDPNGFIRQTETYFTFTVYPLTDFSQLTNVTVTAFASDPTIAWTNRVVNRGNETLTGRVVFARCDSISNPDLPNWDCVSIGQPWEISTNRFTSAPYSLHCKLNSSIASNKAMHATITFPPCRIGKNASISFNHWIYAETDTKEPWRAYDAGVVEYSLDGGETFSLLPGPYTHTVYGWDRSPWTNGTHCFSGAQTAGWQRVTFDLAQCVPEQDGFYGEDVLFRFNYGSDDNTDKEGWYIDDISVYPLLNEKAFGTDQGASFNFSIAAGRYRSFTWYNLPTLALYDDDAISALFLSNDPYQPVYAFDWRLLIAYPETRVQSLSASAGRLSLSWPTMRGYFYTLESTPMLVPADWRPVTNAIALPGDGNLFSYTVVSTNNPSLFLRVKIER